MAAYAREYPQADVVLFEPAREDAQMFFANIFGYAQRERLCAAAYATTRADLARRADTLEPLLRRHGVALHRARLADRDRRVTDALCDPRPLRTEPRHRRHLRQATRDLAHALDHLERQVAVLR